MSGQSETKLLKLVCKQAVLIREPYRHSPWSQNYTSQTNKKDLNVQKKPKQAFQSGTVMKKKNCSKTIIINKKRMYSKRIYFSICEIFNRLFFSNFFYLE